MQWVYPRVCGGTYTIGSLFFFALGLSPRVRGNRRGDAEAEHPLGSIPACAGEPRRQRAQIPEAGVYPRVCGGTKQINGYGPYAYGLSPRVRGNQ